MLRELLVESTAMRERIAANKPSWRKYCSRAKLEEGTHTNRVKEREQIKMG